ncbi:MAG: ORC1-type DNA replication protein [Candidatus Nezhaarchaeales archaeon]|nr:MAG: cell division control protein Cdc6 [Candidatus Nezhaarchaeota archaeon WYZ-LMO8]TDA37192.1 MAG: cell division control protein Cdc6 [Candidatus Nezhaarchaeota archaeon WYZ-LMO7]
MNEGDLSFVPSKSVFKDERALSFEYVPPSLPHREKQLKMLMNFFRYIAEGEGGLYQKALLIGDVGTGKTATSKLFGSILEELCRKRGEDFKFVYVNCYRERTLFLIGQRIMEALAPSLPTRGLSPQELLRMVVSLLKEKRFPTIIVLDEVHYFVKTAGQDALYNLLRILEGYYESEVRLGMLFISRSKNFIYELDDVVRSSLTRNIIDFVPYTSHQLMTILQERVKLAFKEGAISSEALEVIADNVGVDRGGRGDARLAIEILWRAGKIADMRGRGEVTPDDVREASSFIHPAIRIEDLKSLLVDEKVALLTIAKELKRGIAYTRMGAFKDRYRSECELWGLRAKKHTQLWKIIKNLERMGFVTTKTVSIGRGRTTLIGLPSIPAFLLEKEISKLLIEDIGGKGVEH